MTTDGFTIRSRPGEVRLGNPTVTGALIRLGWTGMGCVLPSIAALGVALFSGLWLKRHLGGLTGDVYGAAIEASELAFLVAIGMGAAPRA